MQAGDLLSDIEQGAGGRGRCGPPRTGYPGGLSPWRLSLNNSARMRGIRGTWADHGPRAAGGLSALEDARRSGALRRASAVSGIGLPRFLRTFFYANRPYRGDRPAPAAGRIWAMKTRRSGTPRDGPSGDWGTGGATEGFPVHIRSTTRAFRRRSHAPVPVRPRPVHRGPPPLPRTLSTRARPNAGFEPAFEGQTRAPALAETGGDRGDLCRRAGVSLGHRGAAGGRLSGDRDSPEPLSM